MEPRELLRSATCREMTRTPAPAAEIKPSKQDHPYCGQFLNRQLGLQELPPPHLVDAVLKHTSVNLAFLPLDEGILIPQESPLRRRLQGLFHALNSPLLSDESDMVPRGRERFFAHMLAHPTVHVRRLTHVDAGLAVLPTRAQYQDVDAAPPHRQGRGAGIFTRLKNFTPVRDCARASRGRAPRVQAGRGRPGGGRAHRPRPPSAPSPRPPRSASPPSSGLQRVRGPGERRQVLPLPRPLTTASTPAKGSAKGSGGGATADEASEGGVRFVCSAFPPYSTPG